MSDVQDAATAGTRELLATLEARHDRAIPEIARRIARAKSELGDVRGAVATLTESMAQHPGDLTLVEQCARFKLKLGDAAGVLALLAPLEADAKPNMALLLARARAQKNGAQAAAATLRRALERHAGNPDLARQCATYLMEAGDANGAVALLTPLTDVLLPAGVVVLARAMSETGDLAPAESVVNRALERFPEETLLVGQLAELYLATGRSRDAVELLSQVEDTAPAPQLLLLSKARLTGGDPAGALATLERAVERFPANATLLQGLASARWMMGDAKGALALLDRVPEPHATSWFSARAQALETLGDLPAVEAALRQGLVAFPDDVPLLSQLSKCLTAQERIDEARAVGTTIENVVVKNPKSLGTLVTSYFIFGDAQGAADLIARILSKLEAANPNRATTQALIDLIPGTRLLRADIGVPLLQRILARLNAQAAALTIDQQVTAAVACGVVEDHDGLRRRVHAMTPKLERVKDVIEAISLAAWTNDLEAMATLQDRFRSAVEREQSAAGGGGAKIGPVNSIRVFADAELGTAVFDTGGTDVVILFAGLYNIPEALQQKLVLGPLARGADVVRLFDMRRDVLLSGVGPFTTEREQSFAALKRLVAERGYRRVICAGTSGGGMPAAIYGDAIGADRVVVFSTGTFFPPDDDRLERRARAFLHKVRSTGIEIGSDNLEIWMRPGPHPELHIHYPAMNPQDARHALRMQEAPGVSLYPVATAQHNFFSMLSAEELAAAILGTP